LTFQEEEKKQRRVTKAAAGHFKSPKRRRTGSSSEFRMRDTSRADVKVDIFKKARLIAVSGGEQGQGLCRCYEAGHNFAGGPVAPVPCSTARRALSAPVPILARVPGKKLPGHMGSATVTVKNLKIIEVRPDQNLLFVRGAVPGGDNALVHDHQCMCS